jgi:hypothetical protein
VSPQSEFHGAGNVEVESESTCVLYDPRTGQVMHSHQVLTLKGGERPSEKDVEFRARAAARAAGRDLPELHTLHVVGRPMREPGDYVVDPERRSVTLIRRHEPELDTTLGRPQPR